MRSRASRDLFPVSDTKLCSVKLAVNNRALGGFIESMQLLNRVPDALAPKDSIISQRLQYMLA